MATLYDAVGGRTGVLALARAWHGRCLADPELSHPFSHPGLHPQHVERLAAYWVEVLGGPPDAAFPVDESHVVRLHAGNGEHEDLDRRAIACFVAALDDVGVPQAGRLGVALIAWFTWATRQLSMYQESAEDVPAQLPLPRWGWDGLVAQT